MEENTEKTAEQEYFDKNINISYVDPELPVPDNKTIFKHYFCSAVLYGVCVLLFWLNPWFYDLLKGKVFGVSAGEFLSYVYLGYLIIAPIIYFGFKPRTIWVSHNIIIFDYLKRIFKEKNKLRALSVEEIKHQLDFFRPTYKESQAILVLLIKLIFGTQMLGFAFNNFGIMLSQVPDLINYCKQIPAGTFYNFYGDVGFRFYNTAINIIFLVDLLLFAMSYFTESVFLKNRIRSVDSTPAGILFCIACYPPFFAASSMILGSFHNNSNLLVMNNPAHWLTILLEILALIFISIYLSASFALFTKASNLTNRGTVSRGPYAVVRHPAYISKCLYWFCCITPLFVVDFSAPGFDILKYLLVSAIIFLSYAAWVVIYYFRALTEERHLMQDPEYREYVKKVKYRFIPGLW